MRKDRPVVLGVMKDGSDAIEVRPLKVLLDNADAVTDARGTVGDER